ncbi:MAG: HAD-IA family hydrolase [Oscillospiraceae bacterium]|nr:HAD-IA family hydrolase [Oscillospiraceae bacterium]
MRYKAVLFDLDGTVMNTIEDLHDSVNASLSRFGMPEISLGDTMRFIGNGARRLIEQAVPAGTDGELLEQVLKYYVNYYQDHCMIKTAPYDGITELMRRLKDAGLRQVIISNKPNGATGEIADRYFKGLAEFAIGEKEGLRRKPWPDMVDAAVGRLGLTKEECVLVGDSEVDCITARNAGVDCISVLWGFRDKETLIGAGAAAFAGTPEELGDRILAAG